MATISSEPSCCELRRFAENSFSLMDSRKPTPAETRLTSTSPRTRSGWARPKRASMLAPAPSPMPTHSGMPSSSRIFSRTLVIGSIQYITLLGDRQDKDKTFLYFITYRLRRLAAAVEDV
ncbi:hypothetical protein TYRP_008630 [Tyrophagus putrescentiae]|nr:hypothetical protein TYRP_008630 [Tyrophagus putrescentiae]